MPPAGGGGGVCVREGGGGEETARGWQRMPRRAGGYDCIHFVPLEHCPRRHSFVILKGTHILWQAGVGREGVSLLGG